jgi:hypothetical protein
MFPEARLELQRHLAHLGIGVAVDGSAQKIGESRETPGSHQRHWHGHDGQVVAGILEDAVERLGLPLKRHSLGGFVVLHALNFAIHLCDAVNEG